MEKKLLIIDDDLGYITIVQKLLKKEGFSIHIADTIEKIHDYLEQNSPDVILIDVLMDNNSGFKFLKMLKKEIVSVPIIVISKGKDIHIIERAFKSGAFDYLIKPFNLKDLHNKIMYSIESKLNKKIHHV